MRVLTVWWEGAVVGSLTADRHGEMRFAYDGGWVANRSAAALSVSLPKRLDPFPPRACRPFFEGLLPEGAQRDAVAAALGVSPANEFKLLERLGGEVAGALTLWPADETPPAFAAAGPAAVLSDDDLAGLLTRLDARLFLAGTRGVPATHRRGPRSAPTGQVGLHPLGSRDVPGRQATTGDRRATQERLRRTRRRVVGGDQRSGGCPGMAARVNRGEIQRRQPPRSQRCEKSSAAQFAHRAVRFSPFPPLRFWR